LGQGAALEVWRSKESDGLDWTCVSPAAEIGDEVTISIAIEAVQQ